MQLWPVWPDHQLLLFSLANCSLSDWWHASGFFLFQDIPYCCIVYIPNACAIALIDFLFVFLASKWLVHFIVCIIWLVCVHYIKFQFQFCKAVTLKFEIHLLWALSQSVCYMLCCCGFFGNHFHWLSKNKHNICPYYVGNIS